MLKEKIIFVLFVFIRILLEIIFLIFNFLMSSSWIKIFLFEVYGTIGRNAQKRGDNYCCLYRFF